MNYFIVKKEVLIMQETCFYFLFSSIYNDFTKLDLGRVTCFVEITRIDDGTWKYSYSDYFLKDGSEDAAYAAYA